MKEHGEATLDVLTANTRVVGIVRMFRLGELGALGELGVLGIALCEHV